MMNVFIFNVSYQPNHIRDETDTELLESIILIFAKKTS